MFIQEAIVFNNYSYKYYKTRLIRSRLRRTTREIVKGFNQKETKQGASKWIKVTWLKWPLHINVTSVINNFGGKHIQLPAHWSPFAPETANSHGVTGCEYHLTVVLPCVGLLALSVQKCWSWLLSPIKRVEAVAALCKIPDNRPPRPAPPPPPPPLHCVCFSAGLRALISGAEIWQSQQVMTEAVVRSHPEPQRRLAFQADEGLVQYPQHKEILCKCAIVQKNRRRIKGYFHIFSTFVNF